MKDTPESVARLPQKWRRTANIDALQVERIDPAILVNRMRACADELESLTPTPQAAPASPATGDWFADTLAAAGEVIPLDAELPGMWERADLTGGATDAAEAQAAPGGEAVAEVRDVLGFPHMVWIGRDYPVGTKLYTHPARSEAAPEQAAGGSRWVYGVSAGGKPYIAEVDSTARFYIEDQFGDALARHEYLKSLVARLNAAPLPAQVDEGKANG